MLPSYFYEYSIKTNREKGKLDNINLIRAVLNHSATAYSNVRGSFYDIRDVGYRINEDSVTLFIKGSPELNQTFSMELVNDCLVNRYGVEMCE